MPFIGPFSICRLAPESCKPVSFNTLVCRFTLYIEGRNIIILVYAFFLLFTFRTWRLSIINNRYFIFPTSKLTKVLHLLLHGLKHPLLFVRLKYKEFILLLVSYFRPLVRLIKLCQYFLFSFP